MTLVIAHDPGGLVAAYAAKVLALMLSHGHVAILGLCASACTLVLSLPADQLCAGPQAVLGFHAASDGPDGAMTRLMFADYPPALQARLGALGKQTVWLRQPEISRFVRPCA